MTTTITVSGMGKSINYEAEVIKRTLEAAGLTVIYKNPYPSENPDEHLYLARQQLISGDWKPNPVELIIQHQPWPG